MLGRAEHLRIVAIGDDQPGYVGTEMRLFEGLERKARRNRPAEAVTIIEIFVPLAIATQVRARAFDLDNRDAAFGIDRHDIGAPAVAKGNLANADQILPPEEPRDPARDISGDERSIVKAVGQSRHDSRRIEQAGNDGKARPGILAPPRLR